MVDKVVGEELSEPMLEAKLDVMLEVKLDAKGFTTEKTLFGVLPTCPLQLVALVVELPPLFHSLTGHSEYCCGPS